MEAMMNHAAGAEKKGEVCRLKNYGRGCMLKSLLCPDLASRVRCVLREGS